MASTFHTLILDSVPVLTLSQKNEARRFITLLDALYEARCKLIMHAEAGPDDIFFPEIKEASDSPDDTAIPRSEDDGGDAVYPETLSEIYQDQTSPFRPTSPHTPKNQELGTILTKTLILDRFQEKAMRLDGRLILE